MNPLRPEYKGFERHSKFDVDAVRREFPVTQRMLYLDSAHHTPLATSIRASLQAFYD
jgi:hypothetical protein